MKSNGAKCLKRKVELAGQLLPFLPKIDIMKRRLMEVRTAKQAEAKVRILADVSPDVREKLDALCKQLDVTRKDFLQQVIEDQYAEHIERNQ